jgi:hypothetical protein
LPKWQLAKMAACQTPSSNFQQPLVKQKQFSSRLLFYLCVSCTNIKNEDCLMFRLFPNEVVKKIFEKTPNHEDQARLAQVNTQFNKISQDETLELNKYKSGCTVHSVGHTHVVLQKTFAPYKACPFVFYAMQGNEKAFNHELSIPAESYNKWKMAMKEDTISLINNLKSCGVTASRSGILLEEALEQELSKRKNP